MALFAIIATPVTIYNLHSIIDYFKLNYKNKIFAFIICFCIVSLNLFIIFSITQNQIYKRLGYHRSFGFGISEFFPKEAANFIKTQGDQIEGNIFNSADIGGYFIWKLYPERLVSLDGRWEVYGDFIFNIPKFVDKDYFMQLALKYNINMLVLSKRSRELQLIGTWLRSAPTWRFIKETKNTYIFKRIN